MDPLTQGALGAAAALAVARGDQVRPAALCGGLAGMAPDLDVLIRSSADPLLFLEVHRQFTHSLAFLPLGALLCAALLAPWTGLSRGRTYVFCLLGMATHGWLDACTSYGTQLLWPFTDLRIAWNLVPVVDPLVTTPLVALGALALRRRSAVPARAALGVLLATLALGFVQRERAESVARALAAERGHAPVSLQAKPSFGNLLVWKTIYETEAEYHVDAVRLAFTPRPFPGDRTPRLDRARDLPWLAPDSQQATDLERFRWFSSGFVALDPEHPDRIIDVRYSMLPNRIDALWGIRLDPTAAPDAHAAYFTDRDTSRDVRSEFLGFFTD